MQDIWKELKKQHGEEGLFSGVESGISKCKAKTTGSYAFDDITMLWGIPDGRIIQYAGAKSSGKTLMSLVAIAEYQKLAPENWGVFIDAEFTWDAMWAASLGVDLERVFVIKDNDGAKIFETLCGKPKVNKNTGEVTKSKMGLLDLEMEEPSGLGIIVLDSVAFIQPPGEKRSASGKDNMSLLARFLPPELRRLTPMLYKTGVTFIGINQVRTDPGKMFGDPTMTPGGNAWDHAQSMMIMFGKVGGSDGELADAFGDIIGHTVRVKLTKNKLGPQGRKADIMIKYDEGIVNKNIELRELGAKYGVIERPNNRTWIYNGETYNSKDAMAEALLNPVMAEEVFEAIKVKKAELMDRGIQKSNNINDLNKEDLGDE